MTFYNQLIKDEMDENLASRLDQQSPPSAAQLAIAQAINGQVSSVPLQNLPLAPLSSNNNNTNTNSLVPVVHRRMDMDSTMESLTPLARSRSNTWPVTCPDYPETEEPVDTVPAQDPANPGSQSTVETPGPPKKNTSRRNPWGNLSYADLIAKAISSSPDTRATLSQVYDWMVQNIPYFKDKGDSNSSAGWKVSTFISV